MAGTGALADSSLSVWTEGDTPCFDCHTQYHTVWLNLELETPIWGSTNFGKTCFEQLVTVVASEVLGLLKMLSSQSFGSF